MHWPPNYLFIFSFAIPSSSPLLLRLLSLFPIFTPFSPVSCGRLVDPDIGESHHSEGPVEGDLNKNSFFMLVMVMVGVMVMVMVMVMVRRRRPKQKPYKKK